MAGISVKVDSLQGEKGDQGVKGDGTIMLQGALKTRELPDVLGLTADQAVEGQLYYESGTSGAEDGSDSPGRMWFAKELADSTKAWDYVNSGSVKPITDYGGIIDGASISPLIKRALASYETDESGLRRGDTLDFPYRQGGYYIDETFSILKSYGISVQFAAVNGSVPEIDTGELGFPTYENAQLKWIGPDNLPMVEFSGATFMSTLRGLSTWGYDPETGFRASVGVSFGRWLSGPGDLVGRGRMEDCWMQACRIGYALGQAPSAANNQPDVAAQQLSNCHARYNVDIGIYMSSGNAASINLNTCGFVANGYAPTEDGLGGVNPFGIGCNIFAGAGDITIQSSYTAAGTGFEPTHADFYVTCKAFSLKSHWAEVEGVFMYQSGPCPRFNIAEVTHYNGDFDEENTPVSMQVSQGPSISNCEMFGDIEFRAGQNSSMHIQKLLFTDDVANRPSGKGTITGLGVDLGGVWMQSSGGNKTRWVRGGGTFFDITTQDRPIAEMHPGYDAYGYTQTSDSYLEFVTSNTPGEGTYGIWVGTADGVTTREYNCVRNAEWVGDGTDLFTPIKAGPIQVVVEGGDKGLECFLYVAPDLNPVLFSDFKSVSVGGGQGIGDVGHWYTAYQTPDSPTFAGGGAVRDVRHSFRLRGSGPANVSRLITAEINGTGYYGHRIRADFGAYLYGVSEALLTPLTQDNNSLPPLVNQGIYLDANGETVIFVECTNQWADLSVNLMIRRRPSADRLMSMVSLIDEDYVVTELGIFAVFP